jgi:hypothetical protein
MITVKGNSSVVTDECSLRIISMQMMIYENANRKMVALLRKPVIKESQNETHPSIRWS